MRRSGAVPGVQGDVAFDRLVELCEMGLAQTVIPLKYFCPVF